MTNNEKIVVDSKLNDFNLPTYVEYSDASWESYTYDKQGKLTSSKSSSGAWETFKYNTDGRLLRSESGRQEGKVDKWCNYQYDDLGNQVYYSDSEGNFDRREYDNVCNLVYVLNNKDGIALDRRNESKYYGKDAIKPDIIRKEKNGKGQLSTIEFNDGTTVSFTYPENNSWEKSVVHKDKGTTCDEASNGSWLIREYDSRNVVSYVKDSDKNFDIFERDENGKEVYHEFGHGQKREWVYSEYDDNGNTTFFTNNDGEWFRNEYDKSGNCTHTENYAGNWENRKYNSKGDLVYKENRDGELIDKRRKRKTRPLPDISGIEMENNDGYEYEG